MNLDNYIYREPTKECYLDGRYFNKVLGDFPGLIQEPFEIYLDIKDNVIIQSAKLENVKWSQGYVNILRVIINTQNSRHSGVLLLDLAKEQGFYFDSAMVKDKNIILNILSSVLLMPIKFLEYPPTVAKTPGCEKSGFCVAYSIKFVYDYLMGREYNPDNIRSFAAEIISTYGPLDSTNPDIEYGWGGPIFGALGGGALGGLLGGGSGALIGAGLGGLGGYLLTRNRNDYYNPYR